MPRLTIDMLVAISTVKTIGAALLLAGLLVPSVDRYRHMCIGLFRRWGKQRRR